jgi:hypothetical protein
MDNNQSVSFSQNAVLCISISDWSTENPNTNEHDSPSNQQIWVYMY